MKKYFEKLDSIYIILKFFISIPFSLFCRKKQSQTWVIAERGNDAKDNGYYFYKYIKEKHPEIQVKYIISRNSKDINVINKSDRVIFRSFKHLFLFRNAHILISTHTMGFSPKHWVFATLDKKGLLKIRGKRIMLQHGITYNKVPSITNGKFDLFVVASEEEKRFVGSELRIPEKNIKITGFARWDYLSKPQKNNILIMPTWRRYLANATTNTFRSTEYFLHWNNLLTNKKLYKIIKKYNLTVNFYPHYEMRKFTSIFKSRHVHILDNETNNIHDLLGKSSIFITDYTSAAFDVLYNGGDVIYYPFDYNTFYGKHYNPGRIDIRKSNFAFSSSSINEIIKKIEEIVENVYDRPQKNMQNLFKYTDKHNCERIFKEIMEIK